MNKFDFPANFDLLSIIYPNKMEILKDGDSIKGITIYIESSVKPLKSLDVLTKKQTLDEMEKLTEKLVIPITYLFEEDKIVPLKDSKNLENIKNINDIITSFLSNMISIITMGNIKLKKVDLFGLEDINISDISLFIGERKINTDINYLYGSKKFFETPLPYMSNFDINACFDKNALIDIEKVKEIELSNETKNFLDELNQKDKTFREDSFRMQTLTLLEAIYLQGVISARISYLTYLLTGFYYFDLFTKESLKQFNYDVFKFEMSNEFLIKANNKSIYFILSTKVDKKTLKNPVSIEAKIGKDVFILSKNGRFCFNSFLDLVKFVYNQYEVNLLELTSDKISFCKNNLLRDLVLKKKGGETIVKSIEYNPFNRFYLTLDGYMINMKGEIESVLTIEGVLSVIQEFFVTFFKDIDEKIKKS